ncbi:OB-fold-containig protein [Aureivirga sp. CE67]|uniref:OB-fold-containig protein n=1 Tax=Aureivirga sp. CE67 TaxID=1788983 RepID=UPI0018C982F9|nr:OB-fold-containig protein [Aureivirga sp. CE67]
MLELLKIATTGANIIPTALLIFLILYGLIAIVGLIEFDSLDFDIDTDVDVDMDVDADIDTDADISTGGGLSGVLTFFNIGKLPIMIYLFFVAIPMWGLSIYINHLIGNNSFLIGFLLLIPITFVSLLFAKYACIPFVKVWDGLDGTIDTNFVGKMCTVLYDTENEKLSQADLDFQGDKIRLNIKSIEGRKIYRGDEVVIVEHFEENDYYLVAKI